MPLSVLHTLTIVTLCCLPAAGLLAALWLLDVNRDPDNALVQEQEDEPRCDPDARLSDAA